jgi:hypothetical protein
MSWFTKKEKIPFLAFLEAYADFLFNTQATLKSKIQDDFLDKNGKDAFVENFWILRFVMLHLMILDIKKKRPEIRYSSFVDDPEFFARCYIKPAKQMEMRDDELVVMIQRLREGFEEYSEKMNHMMSIIKSETSKGDIKTVFEQKSYCLQIFTDKIALLSISTMKGEQERRKYFAILNLAKQITEVDEQAFSNMARHSIFTGPL